MRTYRALGPLLSRIVPPWRPCRIVPDGFCSMGDAWKVLLRNGAAWGLPVGFGAVPGHRMIAERIGAAAQAGEITCIGMDSSTGELVRMPPAAWRTTPVYGDRALPAERAAVRGRLLRLPRPAGAVVEPLVALHDLAWLVGAALPPPPPDILDSIAEPLAETRFRRNANEDQLKPVRASADQEGTVDGGGAPARPPAASQGAHPWETLVTSHGAGGPPSGMHLVFAEMRKRFAAGEIEHGVTEEGQHLHEWYKRAHPRFSPPTPKSIANKIRHEFKKLRAVQGQKH